MAETLPIPGFSAGNPGTVARPAYTFDDDPDTGLYLAGAGNLRVSLGGVDAGPIPTAGALALDDLSDVATGGAGAGDVLTYGGAAWGPAAPAVPALALDDLTDVATAGEATGDGLVYTGAGWEPVPVVLGGNGVAAIVEISQAAYDLLSPPVAVTLYVITS